MHHVRRGSGRPLLLVHGLGATWQSWSPVLDKLAAEREVIAVDLPGFGQSPPLDGEVTVATLTDAVSDFITEQGLGDVDMVGSSMGARMVMELARRGVGGTVVALDPGGFWNDREVAYFRVTLGASIRLVKALQPVMPFLTGNPVTRTLLFAQFSARPWALSADVTLREMRAYAAAPSMDEAFDSLARGPRQQGATAGSTRGKVVMGWGRHDRVTLARQARRAQRLFPAAKLHWFDHSGHFPMWDVPDETVRLILDSTTSGPRA